jgi:ABC-2 type transport system permease protein
MDKLWLVAKQEYRNRTFKRSFILGTLVIPFLITVGIAATVIIIKLSFDDRPFGYVDDSGALAGASMPKDNEYFVEFMAFPDEASAEAALRAGKIQAYYVIPEGYLETQNVDLYYLEEAPDSMILGDFDDFVRANILPGVPTEVQKRIVEGTVLTVRSKDGGREFQNSEGGFFTVILPMVIAMFFLFAIMGASGYFLQVVTDEKENRTMEVMLTSVSPAQFIGGKSIALVAVGLTQISVWIASIAIAWIVAKQFFETLQHVQLPWDVLLIFAIFFIPSYAIIAGLMICIGSVVTELQEGQQISGVFNLLFTFPIFFAALVFAAPNSPLMIFLSFWPTTSLMTIVMRWGFTIVPWWQILGGLLISILTAVTIIWVAGRLFRLGMLRYGQRITFKTALSALRSGQNQ